MLSIVLPALESTFGIPAQVLYFLAIFPLAFYIYDFYSYKKANNQSISKRLKIIATANLMYCVLSLGMGCYHLSTITAWGWAYVILEVSIISVLIYLEFRAAFKLSRY